MTISSETTKTICAGNGSATEFTFNFKIYDADDITVIYTDADGNETTLTRGNGNGNYAVDGVGESSGTVTYPNVGSAIASGTTLTIYRDLDYIQPTSLSNQGSFYPTAVEQALDRLVMLLQQIKSSINRCLVVAQTDPEANLEIPNATTRANRALGFDADGNATTFTELPTGTVSSAMEDVVNAASIAAARTLLGLGECALEDIGSGLQDSSGDLIANLPTSAVATNQSVGASNHFTQYLATGDLTFTLGTGLHSGFMFIVHALTDTCTITSTSPESFYGGSAGGSTTIPSGSAAFIICGGNGVWHKFQSSQTGYGSINYVIDGGGSAITTGVKGFIQIPFNCSITKVTALANQTGSIVVDIWKDTYANYPPTDADSITASTPVTISSGVKSQNDTLTGWTTGVIAGDVIAFNVDSCATIQRLTISINITKT